MNRIFITGDCHGVIGRFCTFIDENKNLTKDDVMIVAGDWGLIWTKDKDNEREIMYKEELQKHNLTYFIILGNHENYDRIEKLPKKIMFGNEVMFEPSYDNIFYAINGNSYIINGKKFWTMGGGFSVDKNYRIPHLSWWRQEVPSKEELNKIVLDNFNGQKTEYDYIVTHTCPLNLQPFDKFLSFVNQDEVNKDLEIMLQDVWNYLIENNLKQFEWYCGHFHLEEDRLIKFLYYSIKELK